MLKPTSITLPCPAKVNLALSVGASDPNNNNMHPLASWMLALTFADTLKLTALDNQPEKHASQGHHPGQFDIYFDSSVRNEQVDWPLEKDLAYRALQLVRELTGKALSVDVQLIKRIPTGAGLGGGSSDAAAMLVALDELFGLQLANSTLLNLASQLGSDIPFLTGAILGQPSAIVTGLGQQIQPLSQPQSPLYLVLIFPPFGCETKEVYRQFDLQDMPDKQADIGKVKNLTTLNLLPAHAPFNDLAKPACQAQPQLARIQADLTNTLNTPVHITGSGSTMYLIARSANQAQQLANKITQLSQLPTFATRSQV